MDSPHPLSSVRSTGRRDRLTQSIINTRVAELKSPRHSRDSRLLPKGGGFMLGQAEERHFGLSDRSAKFGLRAQAGPESGAADRTGFNLLAAIVSPHFFG